MNSRLVRGLLIIGIVLAPFILGLLLTYQLLRIPFPTDMADQPSVGYQDSPRILPPKDTVPIQGPIIDPDGVPVNSIVADATSLQRGKILYSIHCQVCHGKEGHGDGPLAVHFKDPKPRDLTEQQIKDKADGRLFITILEGYESMPSLAENLTPREAWDIVNFVRTLPPLQSN
jgi:cytochrome c5